MRYIDIKSIVIQRMEETLHIKISREDKIKLIQNSERLNLPLNNYLRMLVKRELSKKEAGR